MQARYIINSMKNIFIKYNSQYLKNYSKFGLFICSLNEFTEKILDEIIYI